MQKLSPEIKIFLEKETTKVFLHVAKKFIELLEDINIDNNLFYAEIYKTLVNLYSSGFFLEEIPLQFSGPHTNFDEEKFFENKNQGRIAKLGINTFYQEVFDPYAYQENGDSDICMGSLIDDFADIYKDLKTELTKIEIDTDEAVEDALWQLKWSFNNHWGQYCISALRALHFL